MTLSRNRIYTFLLPLLFIMSLSPFALPLRAEGEINISASLSRTTIAADDSTVLSITVEGARSADVKMPMIKNLTIHKGGKNVQMQYINGTFSSSIVQTYIIEPHRAGKYSIPPITVTAGDKTLTTPALSFIVEKGNSLVPQQQSPSGQTPTGIDYAFMEVEGVPKEVYSGQTLPVAIKAYFAQGMRVEIDLPVIVGESFVMKQASKEPEQKMVTRNGRSYTMLTWETTVTSIRSGRQDFAIGLDATLLLPQRDRRSPFDMHSFFDDDFFSGMFNRVQRKEVHLKTPLRPVSVLPLPEKGKPADFNGAIGNFSLHVTADPSSVSVGEPINLGIVIEGEGNFDRVHIPEFPATEQQWKSYPPTSQFTSQGNTSFRGEKNFEQALVPAVSDIKEIPALSFSYFNPQKKHYETVTSAPIPIEVKGSANNAQPNPSTLQPPPSLVVSTPPEETLPLAPLALNKGSSHQRIDTAYTQAWFWLIFAGASVVLLVSVTLFLLRRHRQRNSYAYAQTRRIREVMAQLDQLGEIALQENTQQFFTTGQALVRQVCGHLWQMEPQAITGGNLADKLPPGSAMLKLFITADHLAYGGSAPQQKALHDWYDELKKEVEEVL